MKFNPEYDDEAGMADNNLETLKRSVEGIDDIIQSGDNLPEWCQEKIAVAKSMLVTVWDYMLSDENKEQDVAEGSDWGEPQEILADVMSTLERQVEWPLTDVMDSTEVQNVLQPVRNAINKKIQSLEQSVREGIPYSYGFVPGRKKPNATTRHLRDYPVSDKDVAKPVKKPEKKKPEQGVAEGSLETDNMVSHIGQIIQSIYPRGGDKNTYMKLVAQEMPRIVRADPKLFRRAFGIAYDRFFHIDQDDDFDYTDYSMRKGERGMEEGKIKERYDEWDEADTWYKFNTETGRLVARDFKHAQEKDARASGYSQSQDQALRRANIIRSKFSNDFKQKQGSGWVTVYPYGKPDMSESNIEENKKGVKAVKHTVKARNPVAKNANAAIGGGAAGAHKNEKKASQSVRGQKHKSQEPAYESQLLDCLDIIIGRK